MTNRTKKKKKKKEEAERIVVAAAKIIRAEIRERKYDTSSYPTNEDVADLIEVWDGHHTIYNHS